MLSHFAQALVAWGPLGVFLLALIDSAGVPVAAGVDALVIFLAVQSPGNAWVSALLAVIGSTIGNFLLFAAARRGGRRFVEKSARPGRAQRFKNWFLRYGLVTIFVPAFIPFPMPLKLFVISAGMLGTKTQTFLGVVLLARALRYGAEVWLGIVLGHASSTFLKAHVWHFALGGLLLLIILYLLVYLSDSRRRALQAPAGTPPRGT